MTAITAHAQTIAKMNDAELLRLAIKDPDVVRAVAAAAIPKPKKPRAPKA
jgi:hypothetical protein